MINEDKLQAYIGSRGSVGCRQGYRQGNIAQDSILETLNILKLLFFPRRRQPQLEDPLSKCRLSAKKLVSEKGKNAQQVPSLSTYGFIILSPTFKLMGTTYFERREMEIGTKTLSFQHMQVPYIILTIIVIKLPQ